ncbi:hypothetical protein Tco_0776618 [Tanacetum coccineum]
MITKTPSSTFQNTIVLPVLNLKNVPLTRILKNVSSTRVMLLNLDCLLDIDEKFCPLFVLQFYKTFHIKDNEDGTMSIGFSINGNDFLLPLHPFTEILRVPCIGACMFTTDWSLGFLPYSTSPSPAYRTTLDDSIVVRDTIFTPRTVFTQRNKGKIVAKDAMKMELNCISNSSNGKESSLKMP